MKSAPHASIIGIIIVLIINCTIPPSLTWQICDKNSVKDLKRIVVMAGGGMGEEADECIVSLLMAFSNSFSHRFGCVPFDSVSNREEGIYLKKIAFPGKEYFPTHGMIRNYSGDKQGIDPVLAHKIGRIFHVDAVCIIWVDECGVGGKGKEDIFYLQVNRCADGETIARCGFKQERSDKSSNKGEEIEVTSSGEVKIVKRNYAIDKQIAAIAFGAVNTLAELSNAVK